jgi:hypothetical protein
MHRKYLIPILTSILGFSLAWMLKPAPPRQIALIEPSASGIKPSASAGQSGRIEPDKRSFNPLTHTIDGKEIPPQLVTQRTKLAEQLRGNLAKKDMGQVQRLTELLHLTPEQQQQVLSLYETKRTALNLYQPGDGVNATNLLEKAEVVEVKFNQMLSEILDESQIEQFNAFRKQQGENRRLADVQKDFADVLEKVDLSPAQQESLQDAMKQAAMSDNSSKLDKTRLFEEAFDAMGFGGAGVAMSEAQSANTKILQATDRMEMAKILVDERKNATAERIALLRNVLTPAQLAQYTAVLESRNESFYSSIIPHLPPIDPSSLIEEK